MSFLQISCARPGHRRAGVSHPAFKVWPADAFSAKQLDLLRSDPTLNVLDVATADGANPAAAGPEDLDQDARRRLVTDVIRLLMLYADEPLIIETAEAVLKALDLGTSPTEFHVIASEIGRAHDRGSATHDTEGAPPADADAPGSTATTTISGAAETEASGAVPASPETEAGEGGKGAEADAAEASPPARSEAAKPRRKAR